MFISCNVRGRVDINGWKIIGALVNYALVQLSCLFRNVYGVSVDYTNGGSKPK